MAYLVKEIVYTLQGEGVHAGRPAVFLRFAGCNLWSGKEAERATAACRYCDVDFVGTDGTGGGKFDSADTLASVVAAAWGVPGSMKRYVVCTGGEPLLQLDSVLVAALRKRGFSIAVETNGTLPAPSSDLWLTVSPKAGSTLALTRGDELKLDFPQRGAEPERYEQMAFRSFFLQPIDGPNKALNTRLAVEYCLAHPTWRLSVRAHRLIGMN